MDNLHSVFDEEGKVPDLDYLVTNLVKILEFMNEECNVILKRENKEMFKKVMEEKFPEFVDKYYSVFQQLLTDDMDSFEKLLMMIEQLNRVKIGEIDLDEAFEYVREKLSGEYIYPQFGGKEAFEKTIKERAGNKGKKHF